MKFTTLSLSTTVDQMFNGSIGLFRAAPDNQKPTIALQVTSRIEDEIKREGKIYLTEESAYKTYITKCLKEAQEMYLKASKDMKELQGLKHKTKNADKIKALHKRIDQANMFVGAVLGNSNRAGNDLTAHQGWRGEIFSQTPVGEEMIGKAGLKDLDAQFKKIREQGVAIISSLSAPKLKIEEIHKRTEALSKAASLQASDLLTSAQVWNYADEQFRKIHQPSGAEMGGLTAIKQVIPLMKKDLPVDIKNIEDFIKSAKAKDSTLTPKAIGGYVNANNRKVVTHRGHIEKAKARNETVKTRCAQIQKLNKKAALPPPLLNMLKTALQDVKNNEKLIGETEKLFKKFEKAVEKDLSKLGK